MKYLCVRFELACDSTVLEASRDLLCSLAGDVGFDSFEENGSSVAGYVPKDVFDKEALDAALEDFPIEGVGISYEVEEVANEDWNAAWEEAGFEPIDVDGKVLIFDARKPIPSHPVAPTPSCMVGIAPRMSFGSGTHETTHMVVSVLAGMDLKGKRVLDCGCGTGILAITAMKLGAKEAVGYDIDEWCVENAHENAELNRVSDFHVFHGDSSVLSHVSGIFDIVVANINRNIILQDMEKWREVMTADGTMVLSGFYEDDIESLVQSYGVSPTQVLRKGDWRCLVFNNKK